MATVSMPLNSRAPAMTMPTRFVLEIAREAIRRVFGSQKAAATDLGVEQAQLSRMLAGIERFPLEFLERDERLLDEFVVVLASHRGHQLRVPSVQERRLQRVRQLKMHLLKELDEELAESA